MRYKDESLTGDEVLSIGDIIENVKTGYPHLDAIGDTGWLADKSTHKIARYIVIKTHRDPETNEALTKDVQLISSLDSIKVLENPQALCAIHNTKFPCSECAKLTERNYRFRPWH